MKEVIFGPITQHDDYYNKQHQNSTQAYLIHQTVP